MCAALVLAGACSSSKPPTPGPPGNTPESVTGRERLGWDQQAASVEDLATFRYAIYVDNVRGVLADVTCGSTPGPAGFPCSASLPSMPNGSHVLELAAFVEASGTTLESSRSPSLRVTVTGITAPAGTVADGDTFETPDGLTIGVEVVAEGLANATALVIAPDGRAFVGTERGVLLVANGKIVGVPQLADGVTLAIDLSPEFATDHHVFITQAIAGTDSGSAFRTVRVTDMGGWLAQRMVILEHGPASFDPSAALRFGPDRRLYLAFDDGGSADAADRLSEWRGKLLRMEPDGRTPDDQAAASPVLWHGLTSPRGLDWAPSLNGEGPLWIAERSRDGVERLRVITSSERPRRATQRASYVLPEGLGASALAFHPKGDLFVAGRDGGYVLRIRFDEKDPNRPALTEKWLEGRIGAVRAMTMAPDGAIYVCTDTRLLRLRAARRP
jgi:glucose/arabinose dehydrogenase